MYSTAIALACSTQTNSVYVCVCSNCYLCARLYLKVLLLVFHVIWGHSFTLIRRFAVQIYYQRACRRVVPGQTARAFVLLCVYARLHLKILLLVFERRRMYEVVSMHVSLMHYFAFWIRLILQWQCVNLRSFVRLFVCSFVRSFVRSFVCCLNIWLERPGVVWF